MSELLYNSWFANRHWWFHASPHDDQIITTHFQSELDNTLFRFTNPKQYISAVILLDQIPRHVFRNQPCEHIVLYFRKQAVKLVHKVIEKEIYKQFNSDELCFALLPYRHSNIKKYILTALDLVWERLDKLPIFSEEAIILKRFLKASYANIPHDKFSIAFHNCIDENYDLEDVKHILSYYPGKKPMYDFKDTLFIEPNLETKDYVIVSLSGGVDSMMMSWHLKNQGTKFVVVHINYENRHTCDDEELFVKKWCNFLGVDCFIRRIEEINREDAMKYDLRQTYEQYTREVRYHTYKSVWNILKNRGNPIVYLGHNKDDCLENIFTNLAHGHKYDNLCGMTYKSLQDEIIFKRPLLNVWKQQIINHAMKCMVPYLPTSTPDWSQRGKIRNSVVPCLENWDTRVIDGLFNMVQEMNTLYAFMKSTIGNQNNNNTFSFPKNSAVLKCQSFWKEIFTKMNYGKVSNKSLESFISALQSEKERNIILSKTLHAKVFSSNIDNIIVNFYTIK